MSRFLSLSLLLLFLCHSAYAQPGPNDDPQLSVPISITDGTDVITVFFGLDVRATAGVDDVPGLQENTPDVPLPPTMDANLFISEGGARKKRDYRFGNGNDQSETHILVITEAPATEASDMMTISWALPNHVSGILRQNGDGPTIATMSGSGSATVQTDIFNGSVTVQMDISYTNIPDGTLPVELTSFTSLVQDTRAVLRWETASETNNAGFEVQQRVNGDYSTIGFVNGRGTTTETQRYTFRTRELASGSHDFRLKQIDFDGTFAYSHTVSASIALAGAVEMAKPYPDPFNPQTQFTMTIAREQQVTVAVYDMMGRHIQTLHQGALSPSEAHLFTFEASNLPSGRYFIRAVGEFFNKSQSVTLLK
ncbi:MAG: T9SS type A sorting domain-containing protein [Rhodothermales bacterium]